MTDQKLTNDQKNDCFIELVRNNDRVKAFIMYKSIFGEQPIVKWVYDAFHNEEKHIAFERYAEVIPTFRTSFLTECSVFDYCKRMKINQQTISLKLFWRDLV